jgi:hypothetical protein
MVTYYIMSVLYTAPHLDRGPGTEYTVADTKGGRPFTREEWQDISGCCLCRVEGSELQNLNLWENPRAGISIPPQVHSVLDRGAM